MTGIELKTQFQNLVDDDFDTTHMYQLFSQAKNYIERVERLEICKAIDSSQTAAIGESYNNPKSLPSDFRSFIKLMLNTVTYTLCRFEDQITFRGIGRRAFLDMKNNRFAPTSPVSQAGTWYLFYIAKTEDFTEANENTDNICTWPEELQPLIPYQAAKIYQANIDADAIAYRMSEEQEKEYNRLYDALKSWNADLVLASMDGRTGFDQSEEDVPQDIGLM